MYAARGPDPSEPDALSKEVPQLSLCLRASLMPQHDPIDAELGHGDELHVARRVPGRKEHEREGLALPS